MSHPVLIVLHREHSTPGRVGLRSEDRGITLDIRRPRFGDPLPETLDEPRRRRDLRRAAERQRRRRLHPARDRLDFGPAQGETSRFSASASARRCWPSISAPGSIRIRDGHAEVGYYPIRPTDAGRALCKDWPDHVYQWHREGFDLPRGALLLAEGDAFPVQAFRYGGTAYALQFHMDVTHAMMCRWTTRGHARMEMPDAKQRAAHFEDRLLHDPAMPRLARRVPGPLARRRQPARPAQSARQRRSSGFAPRLQRVDPSRAPEKAFRPTSTTNSAPTPPISTAGIAPNQTAIRPARNSPSWFEALHEQRVDRADAAARLVRRLELDQRHAGSPR